MELPQKFTERMQRMLGTEYPDFISSYERERQYGLRYNPLKTEKEAFLGKMPFLRSQVPWTEEGFYYRPDDQPGKLAQHEAGAYYIQEPSAMAAAEVLSPSPGEKVLDLCAAPGGKSTHLAGKMRGAGLLVSNEIIPQRAKILSRNIERMGIGNAVVLNETPKRLADSFPLFFDKILVDAPCSGEGMFRKEEAAIEEWSLENVAMCADRQRSILEEAARMLRPGGALVYSTCTFSPEENEGVISSFVSAHPEFSIEASPLEKFFSPGREEWAAVEAAGISHTMRLWPHRLGGEGHFIAKLRKEGEEALTDALWPEKGTGRKKKTDKPSGESECMCFCRDFLQKELEFDRTAFEKLLEQGRAALFGEQLYLIPKWMPSMMGLKAVRAGLHLGTYKKNRFEPSHALALALPPEQTGRHYAMTGEETRRYLKGETFPCENGLKGWFLVSTDGYAIGFGKAGNGQMKNHYPKGLRK